MSSITPSLLVTKTDKNPNIKNTEILVTKTDKNPNLNDTEILVTTTQNYAFLKNQEVLITVTENMAKIKSPFMLVTVDEPLTEVKKQTTGFRYENPGYYEKTNVFGTDVITSSGLPAFRINTHRKVFPIPDDISEVWVKFTAHIVKAVYVFSNDAHGIRLRNNNYEIWGMNKKVSVPSINISNEENTVLVHMVAGDATSGKIQVWINGEQICDYTGELRTNDKLPKICLGAEGDDYFYDVIVSDSEIGMDEHTASITNQLSMQQFDITQRDTAYSLNNESAYNLFINNKNTLTTDVSFAIGLRHKAKINQINIDADTICSDFELYAYNHTNGSWNLVDTSLEKNLSTVKVNGDTDTNLYYVKVISPCNIKGLMIDAIDLGEDIEYVKTNFNQSVLATATQDDYTTKMLPNVMSTAIENDFKTNFDSSIMTTTIENDYKTNFSPVILCSVRMAFNKINIHAGTIRQMSGDGRSSIELKGKTIRTIISGPKEFDFDIDTERILIDGSAPTENETYDELICECIRKILMDRYPGKTCPAPYIERIGYYPSGFTTRIAQIFADKHKIPLEEVRELLIEQLPHVTWRGIEMTHWCVAAKKNINISSNVDFWVR